MRQLWLKLDWSARLFILAATLGATEVVLIALKTNNSNPWFAYSAAIVSVAAACIKAFSVVIDTKRAVDQIGDKNV